MTDNEQQPVEYMCSEQQPRSAGPCFSRRELMIGGGVLAAGAIGYPAVRRLLRPARPVFIAQNQTYDGPLVRTIQDGLAATGLDFSKLRGKRVFLKPNLVEPTRESPQMTTHPAVVLAAADVFRRHGAEVLVGEGPGHLRDTELALVEGGFEEPLADEKLPFVDINYSEVAPVANAGGRSKLKQFYFPKEILAADLVVSMPKLKTHHWMGMTASMKNLYGVLPGCVYGWPKNVLHHAGIPETVVDINASLPKTIAIVDAILCMEGDGPILGTPKPMGLVIVGTNPTAVDATCARITGLIPDRIPYLKLAAGRLGPTSTWDIPQRGQRWQELVDPFEILDTPHLRHLR